MIFIKLLTVACRQLAKKLWIIALVAVISAILSYILASAFLPPVYGAEVQVLVSGEEAILENYTRIATGRAVCSRLVDDFDLTATVEQLSDSIRIERLGDSSCLSVRVLCQDPQTSAILTDALVVYTNEAAAQAYDGATFLVYNDPVIPTEPYGMTALILALIVFGAALLLSAVGFCIPLFRGYLFVDRRTAEELLHMPILGVIPSEKDRNGGIRA